MKPLCLNLPTCVFCALIAQNTSLVFAMKFAYRPSAEMFHASSVVVASETCKLCLSAMIVAYKRFREDRAASEPKHRCVSADFLMAVPSLLYIVQNNLLFLAVKQLDPTVYMACSQCKIITTAFFTYVILKVRLNGSALTQWEKQV